MASPPYQNSSFSAISPPYPSTVPLPQPLKRRQSDMPSSIPSNKRRKASMLSTTSVSSHPLRQTSFPPEISAAQVSRYSRSPSVDTASLVSGVSGARKKRGSYRRKNKADDESVVGGNAKSTLSNNSGKGGRSKGRKSRGESVEEEEEEEEGGEELALEMVARTQEEKQKEIQQRAMLVDKLFNADQFTRYEAWRSSKLSDAVVRRIINQTLSQSVPASVIMGIKAAAKVYAGEIIEGARKVQTQWDGVDTEAKAALPTPPPDGDETRRGPLLPEHLVESYRRHCLERDGGSAGNLNLVQAQHSSGVDRFGVRVGGKRLFK